VPLFQRQHRSLILTAQGEALLPEVADAFERLSKASDTVAKALKTKPLRAGRLDALLRPGPGPYPGLHAEVLALAPGFGAHKKAWLVVWPGLARCREFTRARAL